MRCLNTSSPKSRQIRSLDPRAPMWGASSKVFLGNVPEVDQYRDAWHLIIDHLGVVK